MKLNKKHLIPIGISAAMLIASIVFFSQSTNVPATNSQSDLWLGIHGYVCTYVNDVQHSCNHNIITRAGKNMTRDMLTNPNNTGSTGISGLNGTLYISLSNVGATTTEDSVCPTEINANGLTRALGTLNYIGNQSVAASNYSISYKFTATGTQAVQQACLSNSSAPSSAILFAEDTFTSVTLNSGDTINITWFIGVT